MNVPMAESVLTSMVSLGILLYLWIRAYPSMRVEEFRQDIFRLRNQMFDEAAAGNLEFNDAMYKILRNVMNGMLKDADNITLTSFLFKQVLILRYKLPNEFEAVVKPALSALPLERRRAYEEILGKIGWICINFVAKRGLIVYCVFRMTAIVQRARANMAKLLLPAARQTEYDAYRTGLLMQQRLC